MTVSMFANVNPTGWRAEEALQGAVAEAQRCGLPGVRAVSLVMTLVDAGKRFASGRSGIAALESARSIVMHEVATGAIGAAQAERVLERINVIESLVD